MVNLFHITIRKLQIPLHTRIHKLPKESPLSNMVRSGPCLGQRSRRCGKRSQHTPMRFSRSASCRWLQGSLLCTCATYLQENFFHHSRDWQLLRGLHVRTCLPTTQGMGLSIPYTLCTIFCGYFSRTKRPRSRGHYSWAFSWGSRTSQISSASSLFRQRVCCYSFKCAPGAIA